MKKRKNDFLEVFVYSVGAALAAVGVFWIVWSAATAANWIRNFADEHRWMWKEFQFRDSECEKDQVKKEIVELRERVSCLESGGKWNPNYSLTLNMEVGPFLYPHLGGGNCQPKAKGKKPK